ncbi:hypothetical protein, partial [Cytobacillus firmus]
MGWQKKKSKLKKIQRLLEKLQSLENNSEISKMDYQSLKDEYLERLYELGYTIAEIEADTEVEANAEA